MGFNRRDAETQRRKTKKANCICAAPSSSLRIGSARSGRRAPRFPIGVLLCVAASPRYRIPCRTSRKMGFNRRDAETQRRKTKKADCICAAPSSSLRIGSARRGRRAPRFPIGVPLCVAASPRCRIPCRTSRKTEFNRRDAETQRRKTKKADCICAAPSSSLRIGSARSGRRAPRFPIGVLLCVSASLRYRIPCRTSRKTEFNRRDAETQRRKTKKADCI